MRLTLLILLALAGFSFTSSNPIPKDEVLTIYRDLSLDDSSLPDFDLFMKSLDGYSALKRDDKCKKNLITIIDFRLSSNKKRLWVIDLDQHKVLFHSLVAHGRNTGNEYAKSFSNIRHSNQSSLGFYLTAETYTGKHGLSLKLDGQEEGFNTNARKRAVVMHGADYVSEDFIKKHGRLGRSFGCPSVPMENHEEIIESIKGGSCLFIYYPDENYEKSSRFLNF